MPGVANQMPLVAQELSNDVKRCVVLLPTLRQVVHDHAAELVTTELPATATQGLLLHPVHRQQHGSYTLHGVWVAGNHQVQPLIESKDLLLNILHKEHKRNRTSVTRAGASPV